LYPGSSTLLSRSSHICIVNKTKTRTAIIYLDDNSVLHIDMLDGVDLDYEDALDNALVIKNVTGGQRVLKLIDARADFSINKKAQEFINTADIKQTLARAVVRSSKWNSIAA
jgi:hypothetical protein